MADIADRIRFAQTLLRTEMTFCAEHGRTVSQVAADLKKLETLPLEEQFGQVEDAVTRLSLLSAGRSNDLPSLMDRVWALYITLSTFSQSLSRTSENSGLADSVVQLLHDIELLNSTAPAPSMATVHAPRTERSDSGSQWEEETPHPRPSQIDISAALQEKDEIIESLQKDVAFLHTENDRLQTEVNERLSERDELQQRLQSITPSFSDDDYMAMCQKLECYRIENAECAAHISALTERIAVLETPVPPIPVSDVATLTLAPMTYDVGLQSQPLVMNVSQQTPFLASEDASEVVVVLAPFRQGIKAKLESKSMARTARRDALVKDAPLDFELHAQTQREVEQLRVLTSKQEAELSTLKSMSDRKAFQRELDRVRHESEEAAAQKIEELQNEMSAMSRFHESELASLTEDFERRLHNQAQSFSAISYANDFGSSVLGDARSVLATPLTDAPTPSFAAADGLSSFDRPQSSPMRRIAGSPSVSTPATPIERPSTHSGFRRKVRINNAAGARPTADRLLQSASPSVLSPHPAMDPSQRVAARALVHRAREAVDSLSIKDTRYAIKQTLRMLVEAPDENVLASAACCGVLFDCISRDVKEFSADVLKLLGMVRATPETITFFKKRGDAVPLFAQIALIDMTAVTPLVKQIAVDSEVNIRLLETHIPKSLVACISENVTSNYLDAVKEAIRALSALGMTSEGKELLRKLGVVPALVKVQSRSESLRPLVAQCFMILSTDPENRIEIRRRGGIELLVSLLLSSAFSADIECVRYVAGALLNLSVNEKNKESIREAKGLLPIVGLVGHQDSSIRHYALRTLSNLIVSPINMGFLSSTSMVELAVQALADPNANIVCSAVRLLALATADDELHKQIINNGSVSIAGLVQHQAEKVVADLLTLLPQICIHDLPREILFRDGHLPRLISLLKESAAEDRVSSILCVLCYVSTRKDAIPQLVRLGLPSTCYELLYASSAMGVFPHRREAMYLLANMAADSTLVLDISNNARMLQVLQILEDTDAAIVTEALRFLCNVLVNEQIRALFSTVDGFGKCLPSVFRREVPVVCNAVRLLHVVCKHERDTGVFSQGLVRQIVSAQSLLETLVSFLRSGKVDLVSVVLQLFKTCVPDDQFRADVLELHFCETALDLSVLEDATISGEALHTIRVFVNCLDALDEFMGSGFLDVLDDILGAGRFVSRIMEILQQVVLVSEYQDDVLRHPYAMQALVDYWADDQSEHHLAVLNLLCALASFAPSRGVISQFLVQKQLFRIVETTKSEAIHTAVVTLLSKLCQDQDALIDMVHNGGLPIFLAVLRPPDDTLRMIALRTLIAVCTIAGGPAQVARREGVHEIMNLIRISSGMLFVHCAICIALLSRDAAVCLKVAAYDLTVLLKDEPDADAHVLDTLYSVAQVMPKALASETVLRYLIARIDYVESRDVIKLLRTSTSMTSRIDSLVKDIDDWD